MQSLGRQSLQRAGSRSCGAGPLRGAARNAAPSLLASGRVGLGGASGPSCSASACALARSGSSSGTCSTSGGPPQWPHRAGVVGAAPLAGGAPRRRGAALLRRAMFDGLSASLGKAFKGLSADGKLTSENMKVGTPRGCA